LPLLSPLRQSMRYPQPQTVSIFIELNLYRLAVTVGNEYSQRRLR
jgi:hypothetical protein